MGNKIAILANFAAGYPQTKISQQTLTIYAQALADCDDESLKKVMMFLLRTKREFPTVAEILQTTVPTE